MGAMLRRVDYSVVVPVPPVLAFRAFCDLTRLLNRGIYAEAVWIEGEAWRVGSRVRYVVQKPVAAVILAVITSCDPTHSVSVLNHGLGITAEQLISFRATSTESTTVRMVVGALGTSREISENEVQRGIEFLTHDALDTLGAICEQAGRPSCGVVIGPNCRLEK
jgi:hypothetical protein